MMLSDKFNTSNCCNTILALLGPIWPYTFPTLGQNATMNVSFDFYHILIHYAHFNTDIMTVIFLYLQVHIFLLYLISCVVYTLYMCTCSVYVRIFLHIHVYHCIIEV